MASMEGTQGWPGTLPVKRRDVGLSYPGEGGGVRERKGKTNKIRDGALFTELCFCFCESHMNITLVNTLS